MEEFLKLTEECYNHYEILEEKADKAFENIIKSMEDNFTKAMNKISSEFTQKKVKNKSRHQALICDDEESVRNFSEDTKKIRPIRILRKDTKAILLKNRKKSRSVIKLERKSSIVPKEVREDNLIKSSLNEIVATQNNKLDIIPLTLMSSLSIKQEILSDNESVVKPNLPSEETRVTRSKTTTVSTVIKVKKPVTPRITRSQVKHQLSMEKKTVFSADDTTYEDKHELPFRDETYLEIKIEENKAFSNESCFVEPKLSLNGDNEIKSSSVDSAQCQTRSRTRTKTAITNQDLSSIPQQIKVTGTIPKIQYNKSSTSMDQKKMAINDNSKTKKLITNFKPKLDHIQEFLQINQPKSSSPILQPKLNSVILSRENSIKDFEHGTCTENLKKQPEQVQQLNEAKEEQPEQRKKLIYDNEQREKVEQTKYELFELNNQIEQQSEEKNPHIEQSENEAIYMNRLNQEKELFKLLLVKNRAKIVEKQDLKSDFDNLGSEDSTDEEDKINDKKPLPPTWSRSNERQRAIEQQLYIPCKLIDSFFSIAPMSPNLIEIFPLINPKKLNRKSSAAWKTPPRYTLLPKY